MGKALARFLSALAVLGMQGCRSGGQGTEGTSAGGAVTAEEKLPVAKQSAGPFWSERVVQNKYTGAMEKHAVYDSFSEGDLKYRLSCAEVTWHGDNGKETKAVVAGYQEYDDRNNGITFEFKGIKPFSIGGDSPMFSYRVERFVLMAAYDFSYWCYSTSDGDTTWYYFDGAINDSSVPGAENKQTGDKFYYSYVS